MTLLHMETDVVREMANTLRQISQEIDYKIQDVSRSANNMDWVSPARDELVSDIQRLTSMVSAKTDEAITLSDRVHREVSEWEQAASSFLGGDSVQIGNPLIGGGGGGGGGAGDSKIPNYPASLEILLSMLEKLSGVGKDFSIYTSFGAFESIFSGLGASIAGLKLGIDLANAWNNPKYTTLQEKQSAVIIELAFGLIKTAITTTVGDGASVGILLAITAVTGPLAPLGLILGSIVAKVGGVLFGQAAGMAFDVIAESGIKDWCIGELAKLLTG